MDPTFGSQELLESLSQASSRQSRGSRGAAGGGGGGGGDSRGGGSRSSSNSTLTSAHTNPVEDAYRRIGQGLSQRAQGTDYGGNTNANVNANNSSRLRVARLGSHPCTSFQKFQRPPKKPFNPHAVLGGHGMNMNHPNPSTQQGGPSPKIAKLGGRLFQDNNNDDNNDDVSSTAGAHPNSATPPDNKSNQKILKKITLLAKETFHKWRRQQKAGYVNKFAHHQQHQHQYHQELSGNSLPGTISTSASSGTLGPNSLINNSLDKSNNNNSNAIYGRLTEQQLLQQQQALASSLNNNSNNNNNAYDTSPQRYAFSQLALHQQQLLQQQQQQQSSSDPDQQQKQQGNPPKGLLSAVLEGGSESTYESSSVHSLPTINSQRTGISKSSSILSGANNNNNAFHQYPGPSSMGSSAGLHQHHPSYHHQQQQQPQLRAKPALHFGTPRGPCLTQPSTSVGNDGLDNVEGNLILHQSDILVVPGRSPANHSQLNNNSNNTTSSSRGLEFHVRSMLGQGTFAQVFCCWESVSKKHVALKVVKNKPAFTKQAAVEIEVFQALASKKSGNSGSNGKPKDSAENAVGGLMPASPHMVHLLSSFMYKNHLCLVFELLGLNLYEVLKRRQFRGLPLPMVRTLVKQALEGVKELAGKTIVHCDLKPENILLVGDEVEKEVVGAGEGKLYKLQRGGEKKSNSIDDSSEKDRGGGDGMSVVSAAASVASMSSTGSRAPQTIKLIDFGSACFEGYSAHTYIQSRFYRSPEVLMGLPYDSAIDMWSLGCVAAELFLGLPILPGVHEHDQCGRICEMISPIPDWMLEQGSKATKYYTKYVPRSSNNSGSGSGADALAKVSPNDSNGTNQSRPMLPQWRLKTQEEYIKSLTQNEIRKKGGLAKLQKQPANRYFKKTKLADIIRLHGQHCSGDEKELLGMFVHFLYGLLDPDPWKRWTAYQASQHPFITGIAGQLKKRPEGKKINEKEENQANYAFNEYWEPPLDPGICRRKLLNVQRMREKQNAQRRGMSQQRPSHSLDNQDHMRASQKSPSMNSVGSRQPMMVSDSPSVSLMSLDGKISPPSQIASQQALQNAKNRRNMSSTASLPKGGPSSLSAIGNSGLQSALAMENPIRSEHLIHNSTNASQQLFAGPKSFTGLGFESGPGDADFGYALQRPGNVPGLGSDAATVASQASLGSSHAGLSVSSQQQQQQYARMHQNSLPMNSPRFGGGNSSNSLSSLGTSGGYPNQGSGMMAGGGLNYSYQGGGYGNNLSSSGRAGQFDQPGGLQYLAAQQQLKNQLAREAQSSQNLTDQLQQSHLMPAEYNHQLLIQEQQRQLAALQQQHQQQLAALQQQQQLAFQQQQQQFLNQQYGTTGNGYYYVTSADGTPMLMQSGGGAVASGAPMGGGALYDGGLNPGGSYVMQGQQSQQRVPSFDDGVGGGGGAASLSIRDGRSGRQGSRQGGRRGNDTYRGGMSM